MTNDGPVENALLTVMLRNFMTAVGTYLDTGGGSSELERFVRRNAGLAVATVLILWPPQPRRPGARNLILAAGRQLWGYRRWIL